MSGKHGPTAWVYQDGYTIRWKRGTGKLTIHKGDYLKSHANTNIVATVDVAHDWQDTREVRSRLDQWLAQNVGRGHGAASQH